MHATMMDFPLTLAHLVDRAEKYFASKRVVSRKPDRSIDRSTWGAVLANARRLAAALQRLGIGRGDRVGSLAWNHARHLSLYLGIPTSGAVLHTLNLRLHPDEIGYIAAHAGDKAIIVDQSLLPLFEKFRNKAPSIEHVIVIRHDDAPLPKGALDYDAIVGAESDAFAYPRLDERDAAMICYTSGTTGNPKGVVYHHRALVLHALAACMADTIGVCERDVVLPVVPMFHANAWGLPHATLAVGADLVMPGPCLDPVSLLDLFSSEGVTLAAGVPTIWIGILAALDAEPKRWDLSKMRSMLIGGSAAPASMIDAFKKRYGIDVTHAWGMTETTPLGTVARVRSDIARLDDATQLATKASQGYAVPFVETRHVSDEGEVLAWDGEKMGELEVRGPWVASSYLGGDGAEKFTADGWFKTGDVVTIDAFGYVRICDRSKDVIKSGGEWISSVALENALMSHPAVLEAAVFAAKHEKWTERPVAAIVLKPNQRATKEDLLALVAGSFAKFWIPDDIIFVDQIPRTSTGKFLKSKLREQHGDMLLGKS